MSEPETRSPAEHVAVAAATSPAATPLPRLLTAMASSVLGFYVALLTPVQLLLTLHLTQIAGTGAAAAFSLVTGLGAFVALVVNPLSGRISDRTAARFGRRRTWILTGALAGGLALAAMSLTRQVWQVALVWCLIQGVMNIQLAATTALLADQVPAERRGSASGLLGLCTAVAPLIGLAVASAIRQPTVQWVAMGVAGVVGGALCVVLLHDPQHRSSGARLGVPDLLKSYWLNPARHPAFGWAWAVRFLITCAYASNSYNALLLLDRFGLSTTEVSSTVVLLSLITVVLLAVTSLSSGVVSDRLHRQKPFVVASGVLATAGLVMMALAPSVAFVYLATAVLGVAIGLFFAVDSALCVRMLPSIENAGKDLAVINIANTLPQSFVPFVAPAFLALGGYPALYAFLAVLGLLGAVAVRRLPEVGQEGDPRFAPITRERPLAATTA